MTTREPIAVRYRPIIYPKFYKLQPDPANTIFHKAVAFVNQTGRHLFLTGKAGTGKTTFLKYIRDNSFKKMAVVAPTGVAAINAGGVTIHSFFQLPFGAFIPSGQLPAGYSSEVNTPSSLLSKLRLNNARRTLLSELDLLVIDEISMVRADVLDAIDTVLRSVRKQSYLPFGGVQMLYIGDLFQLPPVAKNQEWELLKQYYKSPFFFEALAVKQAPPVYIELKKIYRQKDNAFIDILNNIRNNCCTESDIELLHNYYKPGFKPKASDHYITLTSHNYKADAINLEELEKLPSKGKKYDADISRDFYESSYPADKTLELKEGAQIMFIKNDKGDNRHFYNGKIGTVKALHSDRIVVTFPGQTDELEVEKETWKNVRFNYNDEHDKVEEEELGSFTQFPIRLAWAITIHKSQGLTFERAVIDAGDSFAPGQVYVSLSRLVNLNGLVLLSRIPPSAIRTDERVIEFVRSEQDEDTLQQLLDEEQKTYIRQALANSFRWQKVLDAMNEHHNNYVHRAIPDKHKSFLWSAQLLTAVETQNEVAEKFLRQLEQLFGSCEVDGYEQLNNRVQSAAAYFIKSIDEVIIPSLKKHIDEQKSNQKVKKYLAELQLLVAPFERKKLQLQQALQLAGALQKSAGMVDLLKMVEEQQKPQILNIPESEGLKKQVKLPKGETRKLSLEMFRKGQTIPQIAAARSLAQTTIEGHLAGYILTGEVDVSELVNEQKMKRIADLLKQTPGIPHSELKQKLGDDISYADIKAVVNHQNRQEFADLPE